MQGLPSGGAMAAGPVDGCVWKADCGSPAMTTGRVM